MERPSMRRLLSEFHSEVDFHSADLTLRGRIEQEMACVQCLGSFITDSQPFLARWEKQLASMPVATVAAAAAAEAMPIRQQTLQEQNYQLALHLRQFEREEKKAKLKRNVSFYFCHLSYSVCNISTILSSAPVSHFAQ